MQIQKINLDFSQNYYKDIVVKQNDKDSRSVIITVTDNGVKYPLDSSIHMCNVRMLTPDNRAIYNETTILSDGTVKIDFTDQMVFASGTGDLEIHIATSTQTISTMHLNVVIVGSVYPDDTIIASDEFNALTAALLKVQGGEGDEDSNNSESDGEFKTIRCTKTKYAIVNNPAIRTVPTTVDIYGKAEISKPKNFDFTNPQTITMCTDDTISYRFALEHDVSTVSFPADIDGIYAIPMTANIEHASAERSDIYMDGDNNLWISDRVDLLSGKFIKSIEKVVFDGSNDEIITKCSNYTSDWLYEISLPSADYTYLGLSDRFDRIYNSLYSATKEAIVGAMDDGCFQISIGQYMTANTVAELRKVLAQYPVTLYYVLETPIEYSLDSSEIEKFISRAYMIHEHHLYGFVNVADTVITYPINDVGIDIVEMLRNGTGSGDGGSSNITVPTKVSELENDAGYITSDDLPDVDLSNVVPITRKIANIDLEDDITTDELRNSLGIVDDNAVANGKMKPWLYDTSKEIIIGVYNGKPIYRYIIEASSLGNANDMWFEVSADIEEVIYLTGIVRLPNGNYVNIENPHHDATSFDEVRKGSFFLMYEPSMNRVQISTYSDRTQSSALVVFEYTKTTDTEGSGDNLMPYGIYNAKLDSLEKRIAELELIINNSN